MITAPFNFVPLSEKVFFPDWAEKVSHDIPFEDSESGVIDITITAKSPIFIRNHSDDRTNPSSEFCNYNGQYYIPGSSVKGMIRSVLEILSFSKMSQFNDDIYAVRDLRNRELYMSKMTPDKTFCGWLKKTDDGYAIEDCGIVGRIKHEEIDKIYHMNFASKFKHGIFGNKAKDKTAKYKYELIGEDESFEHNFSYFKKDVNREIYRYHKDGKSRGTLVLTGQPSARKEPQGQKPSGKVYEFVFFESRGDIKLSSKVMQNFHFAYFDGRKTEPKESPDWSYWKKKLEAAEKVPVFFQKNGKEVAHFGLSYLYKLPYSHSVKDGLPPIHNDARKDLAQTMFGYIGKEEALKGRVQFSHFKATQNIKELEKRTEILGTPRASYYPMYVKQYSTEFKTFMNADFSIAGQKRYPIHNGAKVVKTTDTGNENVGTTFTPLKEGVVFEGKVRYHNLKKAELGALLSALTFHNTEATFHNIGLAKPLGYGKIELKIDGIDDVESYLKAFELEVSAQVEGWSNSDQVKELLSMATEQVNGGNSKLKYMELEGFANSKSKSKDYLRSYTALDNISTIDVKSLISSADLEELKVLQEERNAKEKAYQELLRKEQEHEKEWEIVYDSSNIATIESFVRKYPESKYLKTANEKIEALKEEIEKEKLLEGQKEAIEKWEAVLRVDKKYKQKALEDYINNYPNSPKLEEAKKELESMGGSAIPKSANKGLDFSNATDAKSIERVMKPIQNPSSEDKDKLEEAIKRVYPNLNAKKKKQFAKSKLMVRWLGQDRFDDTILDDIEIIKKLQNSGIKLEEYEDGRLTPFSENNGYVLKNDSVVKLVIIGENISESHIEIISKFNSLEWLDLSNNGIKVGTIVTIDIDDNEKSDDFTDIPNDISKLTQLKHLNLSSNEIHEVPESLTELITLETLDLSFNSIDKIPKSFLKFTNLTKLVLDNNPLLTLKEMSAFKPKELISILLSNQEQEKRSLDEVKILILGDGGVGKTSLSNRIIGKEYNPKEDSTLGIDILGHQLRENIKINIWDFAGQEITHRMHKFFLSTRSIYILVLDARKENTYKEVSGWLEDIRSVSKNSPIIIVVNKIDENREYRFGGENSCKKNFENITEKIIYTSAFLNENIELLTNEVIYQTQKLWDSRGELFESWFLVKEELERLYKEQKFEVRTNNFITMDSFEDICVKHGIEREEEQNKVLALLKEIGTITDYLGNDDVAIMNPSWVTNALYKIIRCSDEYIDNGVLNISNDSLDRILKDDKKYRQRDYASIINLLIKFEMAFKLNENEILIASRISADEPSYDFRYYEQGLSLRYKYTTRLKKEKLAHFIVKAKDYISKDENESYWAEGVFLKYDNGCEVVVRLEEQIIIVLFHSSDRRAREFLPIIRDIFKKINLNTKVKEKIPIKIENRVVDYKGYDYIVSAEKQGKEFLTLDINDEAKDFLIKDLLDGYREEELKPLIITEGKTDKRILEIAWKKLYPNKKMPFKIQDAGLERKKRENGEYTEEIEKSGGCEILKHQLEHSTALNSELTIGIFDNDTAGYREFKGLQESMFGKCNKSTTVRKHIKNDTYAILLPVPEFRKNFVSSSYQEQKYFVIEHYFTDMILIEYSMKGEPVIEGTEVFKIKGKKDTFSKIIEEKLEKSDFEHFELLFDVIQKIIKEDKN